MGIIPLILFVFLIGRAQNLTVREIMAEPSIAGTRVSGEKLSPDGSKVIFLWNAEGKLPLDLYLTTTDGKSSPHIILRVSDVPVPTPSPTPEPKLNYGLTVRDDFARARENGLGNFEWSPDSKKLVFTHRGDLYTLTIGEAKPRRYTKTQSPEAAARFIDNDRILYQQNGNLFVLNTADSSTVQLSKEANPPAFISVGGVTISKDGKFAAYLVSDNSKQRALVVPNYLGEFVEAPTTRRGWSDQKVLVVPTSADRDAVEIKLPKPEGVSNFRRMAWAADNRSLVIDRIDRDTKRRQLFYVHNVGSKDEQTILITEETDNKWQAPLSAIFEPHPSIANEILFASERDGFNHLYLAHLEQRSAEPNPAGEVRQENPSNAGYTGKVEIRQMTKGPWQVEWAKWVSDKQILYMSTENGTSTRTFTAIFRADDRRVTLESPEAGMKASPQIDESNSGRPILLFESSKWDQPGDLYSQTVCPLCETKNLPSKLTNTVPEAFTKRTWIEPKFIDIPTRDGKQIRSKVYIPGGFDQKKKYPMVIFVHGAGYLQNTINGWNNYYREFMFNELLTQKGYIVLDIDYRGSAGYGRDWRTDVYDFLGGKDYDDHLDAIDFMTRNYAADPKRVGVYGGSYGGFMAEMLAFRASDKIAAAAALRPVADWKNYYASSPGYTAQRLGFPDKNPEAYKRSSPITYADGLKTQLLIMHGIVDDNVHVEDSMQLTEKLIRLGKTEFFQEQFYPSENHGFVRPTSWADEYGRILAFFEKHLK